MTQTFRYKNIFMYSSLQFSGHVEEYFVEHTEKLVVFIVMPRLKNRNNLLRIYKNGKLIKQQKVWSSGNLLLYYLSWLLCYWYFILTLFHKKEKFIVFSGHPISFFGMGIQRLVRNITFIYWVGDYFPPTKWSLRIYERIKKYYHKRVSIAFYLSDAINLILNGKAARSVKRRTVMWGMKKIIMPKRRKNELFSLLFVGLVKESQGLGRLFAFLRTHTDYMASIIGICDNTLFQRYERTIHEYGISTRVYFPNEFYSDEKLRDIASRHHVGVALYDISDMSSSFYTDPGKVKSYLEMGLPVVMSDTSAIIPYVHRFHCGEVIAQDDKAFSNALIAIKEHYKEYLVGVHSFIAYFTYERYYKRAFKELEDNEK